MKNIRFLTLLFVIVFLFISCEKDDNISSKKKGYIVGFDSCTINHHYKIGYIIITEDLKDTLITYNLSDNTYKMPASVLLNPSNTLYKIPELYFQNYRNSPFFPESLRYEYPVNFSYSIANEDEIVSLSINYQIIIKSVTNVTPMN